MPGEDPLSSSNGLSSSSAMDLGALGLGVGALGYLIGQGPSPLPPEFGEMTGTTVPWLTSGADTLFKEGQSFAGQGQEALAMAQKGELTPEQQAQLSLYKGGLQNTAAQTYASMGRNANQDTSFISTQGNIDTQVNAMAQQQIQSTIALGLGETQAGSTFSGEALSFESAANSALIAAGNAQVQQDKSYSDSLTAVFSAVAKLAPMAMGV